MQKIPQKKWKPLIYKGIAVIGFLLMTAIFLYSWLFRREENIHKLISGTPLSIAENWLGEITNLICWGGFLYLLFNPLKLERVAYISFLYAYYLLFFEPEEFMGALMFTLGLTALYTNGFFRNHALRKLVLFLGTALLTALLQLRFGAHAFLRSLTNTGGHLFVVGVIFVLIFQKQEQMLLSTTSRVLNLLDYQALSDRDREFIKRIMQGEKYEVIAKDHDISVATMRNRMGKVYRILGVADQIDLLATYGGYTVLTTQEEYDSWSIEHMREETEKHEAIRRRINSDG